MATNVSKTLSFRKASLTQFNWRILAHGSRTVKSGLASVSRIAIENDVESPIRLDSAFFHAVAAMILIRR
jgi:hypothetical protein